MFDDDVWLQHVDAESHVQDAHRFEVLWIEERHLDAIDVIGIEAQDVV